MNRGQIRDDVRRSIKDNDPDTNRYRWTDDDLNIRINLAQSQIVAQTGCLEGRIIDNIQSGVSEYALPDIFLKDLLVMWLDSDGNYKRLKKSTQAELDNYVSTWRSKSTETLTHYALRHSNTLIIYPIPNFSRASGIKMDIIKQPDDMTSDTDVPFDSSLVLVPYHDTIVLEVARRCLSDEGKTDLATIKIAELNKRIIELKSQRDGELEGARIMSIYEISRHKARRTR